MKLVILFIIVLLGISAGAEEDRKSSDFLYKNQKISSIDWKNINEKSWLSLRGWKRNLQWREKIGNWKLYFQEIKLVEPVGHLLQCVGNCKVFRGIKGESFFPITKSKLYERDEFQTLDNSYAYLYLLNGTLIRLAPNTSISINEFNLTPNGSFVYIRLNWGQVLSIPRVEQKFIVKNMRETDILFYPLDFYQAHIDIQERKMFSEDELFKYTLLRKKYAKTYMYLNKLLDENLKNSNTIVTKILWTTNNCMVATNNRILDLISLENSDTYLRSRTGEGLYYVDTPEGEDTEVLIRGKREVEFDPVESDHWYRIGEKADEIENYAEGDKRFYMPSLITRRIPTIFIAREKFLQQFSPFLLEKQRTKQLMATKYSFRLWDKWGTYGDSDMRYKFLTKFLHKVERKTFLEKRKLEKRLSLRGEKPIKGFYDERFYSKALKSYLFSQKRHFDIFDKKTGLLNSTKRKFWKIITKQYD